MSEYFKSYLKRTNFDKYLKHLEKVLRNKKVVVYGSGMMFQYIQNNYDLSKINIVGISDLKYSNNSEGEMSLGYKVIPKNLIADNNPDCVLIAIENYIDVVEELKISYREKNKNNIKVMPLVKKPFIDVIKYIWNVM